VDDSVSLEAQAIGETQRERWIVFDEEDTAFVF
jgi:hypothetical protein